MNMELKSYYHLLEIESSSNTCKLALYYMAVAYNKIFRIEDQLKISSQYRIEADAVPTCLIQYPSGRFEEEFLFTANDKFKLRLFNQSTKLPRRITNSQKYDSPIKK